MILPTKIQLNKAKAQETKAHIDEGLALAKRVDAMRQLKLVQEANIRQWKEVTIKAAQEEIDQAIEQRDVYKKQAKQALDERDELRKPLDAEWDQVKSERAKLTDDQNKFFLDKELFKSEVSVFEKEKGRVLKAIEKSESHEKATEKLEAEAQRLKGLAEEESRLAFNERDTQTRNHDQRMAEVGQSATEYEVALRTVEVREQQVVDKESELITRENDLARRIKNFQRVEGK